ncbi:hypothetical protein MNB_SUP05-SYMBIONT-5-877 [hydrothermal vent metagenome]|uniref:Uncharacterized protein n=1 Tax=hydrothermal vent metagenome TaxID=652676 RepID=A0A1W1E5M6_9ZZZZ
MDWFALLAVFFKRIAKSVPCVRNSLIPAKTLIIKTKQPPFLAVVLVTLSKIRQ